MITSLLYDIVSLYKVIQKIDCIILQPTFHLYINFSSYLILGMTIDVVIHILIISTYLSKYMRKIHCIHYLSYGRVGSVVPSLFVRNIFVSISR